MNKHEHMCFYQRKQNKIFK